MNDIPPPSESSSEHLLHRKTRRRRGFVAGLLVVPWATLFVLGLVCYEILNGAPVSSAALLVVAAVTAFCVDLLMRYQYDGML